MTPHRPGGRVLTVAAVSPDILLGELHHNVGQVRQAFRSAAAAGARLVVAPELSTTGFVTTATDAARCALAVDAPAIRAIGRDLPAGVVGVFGFCESRNGGLYNSAVALTRDGIAAVYRKTHLWGIETTFLRAGEQAPVIVDAPFGRIGLAICYDNEFPEVPRGLALAGAEILALPVNWPIVDRPAGEHAPELIQAMAASRSSRMATVIADRRGVEDGIEWTGATGVVSPDGWPVGEWISNGSLVVAEIDLEMSGDKRVGEFNDLLADRRPEIYEGLGSRVPRAADD